MAQADFSNLGGSVTIASPDFSKVLTRHTVEAVNRLAVIAGGDQQIVKRRPIISPVEIKADALTKLALVNFAAPPLVEDVLVAGINRFDAEHHGTVARQGVQLGRAAAGSKIGG